MKPFSEMTVTELRDLFDAIARVIAAALPTDPATGTPPLFCLVVAENATGRIGQYVANGDRSQVVRLLRQTADKIEGGREISR